jgi:hypothetical protein
MGEVENWRDDPVDDDEEDEAAAAAAGPGPKAPSRVNIWTCIRHLINSIGVLLISTRREACCDHLQDETRDRPGSSSGKHQFPNTQSTPTGPSLPW